ncbi:unnamed protein product [Cyprideis torosa]|uniref:Uncharacterized protein n=1 Tax=Cyprideis torosa TaxID=163714 RepID=A0A7R8WQV2_9CRUS|nr:unnamed protein product [Cyprideis torosa]CAG0903442.1 unnamed protein product [Cyprideis torosa]
MLAKDKTGWTSESWAPRKRFAREHPREESLISHFQNRIPGDDSPGKATLGPLADDHTEQIGDQEFADIAENLTLEISESESLLERNPNMGILDSGERHKITLRSKLQKLMVNETLNHHQMDKILEVSEKNPVVLQLFYGTVKPPLSTYQRLVDDMLTFSEKFQVNFVFLADLPARSHAFGTAAHNAKNGCPFCNVEGICVDHVMTFTGKGNPRTDRSIRSELDPGFLKTQSPFLQLKIDLIDNIPVEPMHCLFAGIVKRFIKYSLGHAKDVKRKFSSATETRMKLQVEKMSLTQPKGFFARKPTEIADYKIWKTTQFRQFAMYSVTTEDETDYLEDLAVSSETTQKLKDTMTPPAANGDFSLDSTPAQPTPTRKIAVARRTLTKTQEAPEQIPVPPRLPRSLEAMVEQLLQNQAELTGSMKALELQVGKLLARGNGSFGDTNGESEFDAMLPLMTIEDVIKFTEKFKDEHRKVAAWARTKGIDTIYALAKAMISPTLTHYVSVVKHMNSAVEQNLNDLGFVNIFTGCAWLLFDLRERQAKKVLSAYIRNKRSRTVLQDA